MKTLRHPRLVSLYGVCYSEPLMIVTEFMVNGSLLTYLKEKDGKNCGIPQLIDMGAQIGTGCKKTSQVMNIDSELYTNLKQHRVWLT